MHHALSAQLAFQARDFDAALERAYDARDVHLVFAPVDPKWDRYRSERRFQEVMSRCGFTRSEQLCRRSCFERLAFRVGPNSSSSLARRATTIVRRAYRAATSLTVASTTAGVTGFCSTAANSARVGSASNEGLPV